MNPNTAVPGQLVNTVCASAKVLLNYHVVRFPLPSSLFKCCVKDVLCWSALMRVHLKTTALCSLSSVALVLACACGFEYIVVKTQSACSFWVCGFASAFAGLFVSHLFPCPLVHDPLCFFLLFCSFPSFPPLPPTPPPFIVSAQIYIAFRLHGEIDQTGAYAFRGANK